MTLIELDAEEMREGRLVGQGHAVVLLINRSRKGAAEAAAASFSSEPTGAAGSFYRLRMIVAEDRSPTLSVRRSMSRYCGCGTMRM